MDKLLVLLVLLFISHITYAQDCAEYGNLSPIQKGRLEFAYHQGNPYDLGYTMAAIALAESSAGRFRVNLSSKDVGLFQVNSRTASKVLGVTNYYKRLELDQKLIYDDILNAYIALDVLTYFKKYHKGDWKKMVASYNNGFKINTEKAKNYVDKVSKYVKVLQQCMNTH